MYLAILNLLSLSALLASERQATSNNYREIREHQQKNAIVVQKVKEMQHEVVHAHAQSYEYGKLVGKQAAQIKEQHAELQDYFIENAELHAELHRREHRVGEASHPSFTSSSSVAGQADPTDLQHRAW